MSERALPLETSQAEASRAEASRAPAPSPASSRRTDAGVTVLGTLAGVGAFIAAASCCVLPLAFIALGLGTGMSSTFAALTPLRWPLTALSILGLAIGWAFYVRRQRACAADRTCTVAAPSRAMAALLTISTLLTAVTLLWDHLEPHLMKALS